MSAVGRRVVLAAVPVAAALLVLLAAVWRPAEVAAPAGGPSDQAVLPSQGENVVAVAVEFGDRAGDGLDADNLAVLAEVDAFLRAMEGLRGYSSPLRATVVRATEFDIVVRPFVPAALLERYDERVAAELRAAYERFPEIHPYWSADFEAAAFYLELGSRLAPAVLVQRLDAPPAQAGGAVRRCAALYRGAAGGGTDRPVDGARPARAAAPGRRRHGGDSAAHLRRHARRAGGAGGDGECGGRGRRAVRAAGRCRHAALDPGAGVCRRAVQRLRDPHGLSRRLARRRLRTRGAQLSAPAADADRRHHGDRLPGPGRPGQHRAPVRGGDGERRRAGRPGAGAVVDAGRGPPARGPAAHRRRGGGAAHPPPAGAGAAGAGPPSRGGDGAAGAAGGGGRAADRPASAGALPAAPAPGGVDHRAGGGHLQPGVRGHGAVRGADRRRDGGRLPAPGGAGAPAHRAPDPGRTAGGRAPALAAVGGGAHPPLLRCRRGRGAATAGQRRSRAVRAHRVAIPAVLQRVGEPGRLRGVDRRQPVGGVAARYPALPRLRHPRRSATGG